MIPLPKYTGKKVAIVGLGKTGLAAAHALHNAGAKLLIWDDNEDACSRLPAPLAQYVVPYSEWENVDLLVASPGVPLTHPAPHPAIARMQVAGVPIVGDVELLYEGCPEATYIGITGTNGKSTTTSLIGHILRAAGLRCEVGGNLGEPVLAMAPLGKGEIYVLELSSYQLDLIHTTRFNVAVWLNLTPDHIDRHGSLEGYIAAKQHIFDRQDKDCVAIISTDDAPSAALYETLKQGTANTITLGSVNAPLPQTLQGAHNMQNAAAAWAACRAVGLDDEAIARHIMTFPGLAHRMEWLGEREGIIFVNDSKATNADAAARALGTYHDIYWIAGGVPKEGGIEPLAEYFPRIRKAYLIGEATDAFAQTLEGKLPYHRSGTLTHAFADALADAKAAGGGAIVLTPACASFDQFANFEARGEAFRSLYNTLKA